MWLEQTLFFCFLPITVSDLPSCPGKLALKERAPKSGENVVLGSSKALSVNHLAQPILGEDGTVLGLAEYFVDISEAKQREKELSLALSPVWPFMPLGMTREGLALVLAELADRLPEGRKK